MGPIIPIVLTVLSLFVVTSLPCFAATIHVPADQPTIQAGILAASPGDVVLVRPGTYAETIDFLGKSIMVRSIQGAEETVVDGHGEGSVVTFDSGEGAGTVLDGFTITNGAGTEIGSGSYGGGIFCSRSDPTIEHCTLTGNSAEYGSGLYCGHASPTLEDCRIAQNEVHGVYCLSSSPRLASCTITENGEEGAHLVFSSPLFANCTVTENDGTGIDCDHSSPIIVDCVLHGNVGAAVHGSDYSSPVISNCRIVGNHSGISFHFQCTPVVSNCVIAENAVSGSGRGIYCYHSSLRITNCTLSGNAVQSGQGLWCSMAALTITNSILWGNAGPEGPEIYEYGTSTIRITYSDVEGGWPGEGNIDSDPLFVGSGDYHLEPASSCVDTGDPDPAHDDLCFPPSVGTGLNDMGAYGGPGACGWTCRDVDGAVTRTRRAEAATATT